MRSDLGYNEIELLNAFQALGSSAQKEAKDYIRYLLCKQYKREVMVAVFHNKLLNNLVNSLFVIVERDDFDLGQAQKRVMQIKELYYGIFEQVHQRYSELVEDLDSNEIIREFGRSGFDTVENAFREGIPSKIRFEIIEFYQQFNDLSKRKDARKIIAV